MLHIGHMLLFKHIKEICGSSCKLVVAVQDDSFVQKYKPGTKTVYSTEERVFMVNALRYVDEVVVYREVDKDIKNILFDVLVVGPDQVHSGFQRAMEWCRYMGKEVVVIPRTEGISSTLLHNYTRY